MIKTDLSEVYRDYIACLNKQDWPKVKEQVTTSGRGWSTNVSRSTHEVSRPLLTPDEAMRMKGARKNALEQLLKGGLSKTDARKALEAKEPDLVVAHDNQTVIQRRLRLLAQRQASTHEKKRSQRH